MFDCFARATMAAAEAESTGSSTRTLAPFVIAASACCCCLAASWSAFEYRSSQFGHSALSLAVNIGRSAASYRAVLDSGSSSATFLPPPPPLVLEPVLPPPELLLLEPHAATPTAATAETAAT